MEKIEFRERHDAQNYTERQINCHLKDKDYKKSIPESSLFMDSIILKNCHIGGSCLFKSNSFDLIKIRSLEELPIGIVYVTDNRNRVIKMDLDYVLLISNDGTEIIKIPVRESLQEIVPIPLNCSDIDSLIENTAEAVIEKLTGQSLYSGIPLSKQGEQWGRVIFSLKELIIGVVFIHLETGHRICRTDETSFNIDGIDYLPANETYHLDIESALSSSVNTEKPCVRTTFLGPLMDHDKPKQQSICPQVTEADSDYNSKIDSSRFPCSLEEFDERLELLKLEKRSQIQERAKAMMDAYRRHYDLRCIELRKKNNSKESDFFSENIGHQGETSACNVYNISPLLERIRPYEEHENCLLVQSMKRNLNRSSVRSLIQDRLELQMKMYCLQYGYRLQQLADSSNYKKKDFIEQVVS